MCIRSIQCGAECPELVRPRCFQSGLCTIPSPLKPRFKSAIKTCGGNTPVPACIPSCCQDGGGPLLPPGLYFISFSPDWTVGGGDCPAIPFHMYTILTCLLACPTCCHTSYMPYVDTIRIKNACSSSTLLPTGVNPSRGPVSFVRWARGFHSWSRHYI